ncbi:hypothetical protein KAR48_17325 [bacterium]|nr:hypothetical protein [bacterium]
MVDIYGFVDTIAIASLQIVFTLLSMTLGLRFVVYELILSQEVRALLSEYSKKTFKSFNLLLCLQFLVCLFYIITSNHFYVIPVSTYHYTNFFILSLVLIITILFWIYLINKFTSPRLVCLINNAIMLDLKNGKFISDKNIKDLLFLALLPLKGYKTNNAQKSIKNIINSTLLLNKGQVRANLQTLIEEIPRTLISNQIDDTHSINFSIDVLTNICLKCDDFNIDTIVIKALSEICQFCFDNDSSFEINDLLKVVDTNEPFLFEMGCSALRNDNYFSAMQILNILVFNSLSVNSKFKNTSNLFGLLAHFYSKNLGTQKVVSKLLNKYANELKGSLFLYIEKAIDFHFNKLHYTTVNSLIKWKKEIEAKSV